MLDKNMPELPEVETVKNVLNPILKNRKILSIDVLKTTNIIGDSKTFVSSLTGECFINVTRIGKYLIFHLTNDKVIISHLRMEGKYYELDENDKNSHYSKVVFHLDNGKKICYDDSRGFGQLKLSSEKAYLNEKEIAKLGPSPFEVVNIETIYNLAKDRKDLIKALLQSQEIISGLGNIYVDEVLFRCKIHPHTKANLLNKNDWKNIVEQSCIVLDAAIKAGGSTIKSYHPGKDIDGKFQNSLKVYGKAGEKCPICGKTLRFIKTNGRGTTFCPGCQHKLGKPLIESFLTDDAGDKGAIDLLELK